MMISTKPKSWFSSICLALLLLGGCGSKPMTGGGSQLGETPTTTSGTTGDSARAPADQPRGASPGLVDAIRTETGASAQRLLELALNTANTQKTDGKFDETALKAKAILERRCSECHADGAAEGGFGYILNRRRLIEQGKIKPGSAEDSRIIELVVSGVMPDGKEKLPQAEINTLKSWIDKDAKAFQDEPQPKFISPVDMLTVMLKDLEKANDRDRQFLRYFTLTHLYNAGLDEDELETHRRGLSKLVNSLSWGLRVKVPVPVDEQKTILRIDLRWYKWNETGAWNHIVAADPYRVTYSHAAAQACYALTKCELPHVRADWFVFAAARPPLYHVILDIPESAEAVRKFKKDKLGVDVAKNLIDFNDVVRAAFEESGVSSGGNRLIERHVSNYGALWESYDFKPDDPQNPKRRNLKDTPLGPGQCGSVTDRHKFFEHDGGEIIFNLPNGLQAYLLVDHTGKRIDKGPTDVVQDKTAVRRGRAPDVVNGVSCMSCHKNGMINKNDEVRAHAEANRNAYSDAELDAILALYSEQNEFADRLKEDAARFKKAVEECGAPLSKTEPISALAFQFDERLGLALAAAEAGVTPDKFLVVLNNSPALARSLGSLKVGQRVARNTYVQQFPTLVKALKVGTFLDGLIAPAVGMPRDELTSQFSGMKFALIPAGEFKMGSSAADVRAALQADSTLEEKFFNDEQPQHPVRIMKPFYMGVYEVTQGEFQKVLGRNTSFFSPTGSGSERVSGFNTSRLPVETVTWFDAIEFCNKLSEADRRTLYYRLTGVERNEDQSVKKASVTVNGGNGYRLPTEAEWEYACRANTTTPFHFGSVLNGDKANVNGNYPFGTTTKGPYLERTTVVDEAKYPKNAFGLAQMHGNVWEWCEDVYDESAYAGRSPTTPKNDPLVTGGSEYRVLRGGSWFDYSRSTRSAFRYWDTPVFCYYGGFRVVCSSSP